MIERNPKKLIKYMAKATKPWLHNNKVYFLLTKKVKGGQSSFRNNYGTVLASLESSIKHSQHNENSIILDFSIEKIIKDDDNNIIERILIVQKESTK